MRIILCYVYLCLGISITSAQSGKFWQITDIHLDPDYSVNGDVTHYCHDTSHNSSTDIGYYGNYSCDSPWVLVQEAVKTMGQLEPNPDFILWTGDNPPHVRDPEPSSDEMFSIISNLTHLLKETFPNSTIIPVLGNHDASPVEQFPVGQKSFYIDYLQKGSWNKLIGPDQQATFNKGGYYSVDVGSNLTVVVLNTMLYSMANPLVNKSIPDPASQFQWLKTQLKKAQEDNRKVLVTAHVPPGYFERASVFKIPFLYPNYNDYYVSLILNSSVVFTQLYGHEHTDSFRLFATDRTHIKGTAFLAPSVTPVYIPSVYNATRVNPAVRLYTYDQTKILDYYQYYLDLPQANANRTKLESNSTDNSSPTWKLLYQATKAYNLTDLTAQSLLNLYKQLNNNQSGYFDKYYSYNSVSANDSPCDQTCHQSHICAIAHLTTKAMDACWSNLLNNTQIPDKKTTKTSVTATTLLSSTATTSLETTTLRPSPPPTTLTENTPKHASEKAIFTEDKENVSYSEVPRQGGGLGVMKIILLIFSMVVLVGCLSAAIYCMRKKRYIFQPRYMRHVMLTEDFSA